jgi:hypothetical protein
MFKLRAYIKFRKLGLSRFKALDLARYIDMTTFDKLIVLGCITSIVLVLIGTFYSFDVKSDNVYGDAIKYQAQAYKYEMALIGCLSGNGIIVNGRNLNCEIKEWK